MQVGRVTVIYWAGEATVAAALAELADRAVVWPGIREPSQRRIRLVLASTAQRFDSLTAGRVPEWGVGAAFPASNTIVLRLTGRPRRVLRHELAHLALHSVVQHVPRWFDEGYAARAAEEWDRLGALRVNWTLLRGAIPSLHDLDAYLRRGNAAEVDAAYALSTTAVILLERLGGDRGLEPLLTTLQGTRNFDLALRATHQMTLGQLERLWQRDVRKRYGWLLVFSSLTVFWAFAGVMLALLWMWRRQRDRGRRAALDEGWVIPQDGWDENA